jgi:mRNA interferase YafQ
MRQPKTAQSKRTKLPREFVGTKAFYKDWAKLSASGRYDMRLLKQAVVLLIANDEPLGAEWTDHALQGEWMDHRECHVGGDFLLIYQILQVGPIEKLNCVRAGTHSDLFR